MLPKDKSEEEAKKVAEEKAKQWAIIEKELESFDMDDLSPENKVRVIHCTQRKWTNGYKIGNMLYLKKLFDCE